ncbi:MAG: type II CAAX endopeptidase family protein [Planctomycetota bacterium]|nr:type II CAAX endopeptidase family protein [Planctomycetota bacterium]
MDSPIRNDGVHRVLAWLLVLVVVTAIVVLGRLVPKDAADAGEGTGTASSAPAATDQQLNAARIAVGVAYLGQQYAVGSEELLSGVTEAGAGPVGAVRSAIVTGQLRDAAAATEQLSGISFDGDTELAIDVAVLYQNYLEGSDAVAVDQRARLLARHGWFARLAFIHDLPSEHPAREELLSAAAFTAVAVNLGMLAIIGAVLLGLVVLVFGVVAMAKGRLRLAPQETLSPAYASLFGLYLLGWIVWSLLVSAVAPVVPEALTPWLLWVFLPVLGLGGLAWLQLWGITPATACRQLGLVRGAGWWREIGAGILSYLAGLPLVALALLVGALIGFDEEGAHPVMEELLSGDRNKLIAGALLATVFAPVVEEVLFRGALFGHLRGVLGVVLAVIIQGVVFAVIHPQGAAAIPVLAMLGMVFAFTRAWRGSLIGGIAAHAVHNGMTLCWALLLLG